jgi:hypothetical protein
LWRKLERQPLDACWDTAASEIPGSLIAVELHYFAARIYVASRSLHWARSLEVFLRLLE